MNAVLLLAALKVLAVGNSFSVSLQQQLPPVAKALGQELDLATLSIWGCPLSRHWACLTNETDHSYFLHVNRGGKAGAPWPELESALRDMEETEEVKRGWHPRRGANLAAVLKAERWDVVTVQQGSHESWRGETYRPWGCDLVRRIRELAPQAEVLVQETWSYTPWDKRLAQWKLTPDGMYAKLHAAYRAFAEDAGLRVIPMGAAVQEWRRRLPVRYTENSFGGDVCGSAKFERDERGAWSPKGDVFHLNAGGSYLQALVWAAALFKVDVTGCPYAPEGLEAARARLMKEVAMSAAGAVYVAPDGDDANEGVSRDRPLKTPYAAVEAVRRLRAAGRLAGEAVVEFADGVYRLDSPVRLGKADGGGANGKLVWRAEHRGKSVFTGACAVEWRRLTDGEVLARLPEAARGKVVCADVPGSGPLPSFLNGSHMAVPEASREIQIELFEGGERLVCARYPNEGYALTGKVEVDGTGSPTGRFAFDPAHVSAWSKEPFPWIFGLWSVEWADMKVPLVSADPSGSQIGIDVRNALFGFKEKANFYVFNAFSELDRPGEWVVDREHRRIYLWPKGGTAEVVAGDELLVLRGLRDVTFDGLVFEKCRKTAVDVESCAGVCLQACEIRHTCSWGVDVKWSYGCRVTGCDLHDLGFGGIHLSGGDPVALRPGDNVAENNHIHHYGRVLYNYRQGVSLEGVGNRAVRNLIHHSAHTGIYARGNDHYIGYNVIHDVCSFNNDAGAIYVWENSWILRGGTIEHNVIHFVGKPDEAVATEGIYLDDYSSAWTVRGNFISRAARGVHVAGGQCNSVEDNVMLNCAIPVDLSTRFGWENSNKGRESRLFKEYAAKPYVTTSEVWVARYPELARSFADPDPVHAHHAFWNVIRGNLAVCCGDWVRARWADIRATTTWEGNVRIDADPGLEDYAHFGWTARGDSKYRRTIDGCRFADAGLYASPHRLSAPVRFGSDVTPPPPLRPPQRTALVRVVCSLAGALPAGCRAYAKDLKDCELPSWAKGVGVNVMFTCKEGDGWAERTFSFTPVFDCDFVIRFRGTFDSDVLTLYDAVEVTGVETGAPLFAAACPFEANDRKPVSSRVLRAKKDMPVTIRFRAKMKGDK